jgi:anaerobic ribonucleoside-triphosphate reductase activating protein|nr:MAG TPA: 4Fe-4S single cluster domain protein [Caudoviricetes sp.]
MRYASIRNLDISNGEGVGISLFVQGCDRHCFNCFNSETWDFNGGKEWTEETKNKFMELIDRPYIRRISILGGEPLAEQNLDDVLSLIKEIREKYPISQNPNSENIGKSRILEDENSKEIRISFPKKTIWLYTGYKIEDIFCPYIINQPMTCEQRKRIGIIRYVDILVDGEYIDEQKDLTLKWRGSKNQRCIDVKQSLAQNKMVLYCD